MQKLTFKKEERLCSEKLISFLYKSGSSFLLYPFRITWVLSPAAQHHPMQVLISVPKKKFKRSVDRNLLKRKIKESYRLQKQEHLYPSLLANDRSILLAIHYVGKEIHDFDFLHIRLERTIQLLLTKIEE